MARVVVRSVPRARARIAARVVVGVVVSVEACVDVDPCTEVERRRHTYVENKVATSATGWLSGGFFLAPYRLLQARRHTCCGVPTGADFHGVGGED